MSIRPKPVERLLMMTLALSLVGCGGSAIKRDDKKLRNKCGVVSGTTVDEEQARCIAKIFGVKEKKHCPVEVDQPGDYGQTVYRVLESCNGLGVVVAASTGRVLALVEGDEVLYE